MFYAVFFRAAEHSLNFINFKIKQMKQLLALQQEYILETKFAANQVKDEVSGYYRNDWIDEKKKQANGKQVVDNIILLVQVHDREGYSNSTYQKVWLAKDDIVKLAEKIKEIEAVSLIAVPGDDLPF